MTDKIERLKSYIDEIEYDRYRLPMVGLIPDFFVVYQEMKAIILESEDDEQTREETSEVHD